MSIAISKRTDNVEIKLTAYHNCDDVQLYWITKVDGEVSRPIEDCLGFIIERQRMDKNGQWLETEILNNRVGFEHTPTPRNKTEEGIFRTPSNICPFQKYNWTDHGANSGQIVRYRVSAAKLPHEGIAGKSVLIPIADSGWTEAIKVNAENENISAYFNRGFVMSQFVSRIMRINHWKPQDIKPNIQKLKEPLRLFLSGELRLGLLKMLDEVICDPNLELYAALFELSDSELMGKLKLLQERAHIILADGAKAKTREDENLNTRNELNEADVDVHNRMVNNRGLAHNKFAIVYNTRTKKATKIWSGSTNWTLTGLCTQVNNGFMIEDEKISEIYLDQWHRLYSARNSFTDELKEQNAKSPRTSGNIDVWFAPVKSHSHNGQPGKDIKELIELVNSAKEMILYVMFQPGEEPLKSIMSLSSKIYVRGVVSTLSSQNEEKFKLEGINTESKEYKTRLIQPHGIEQDLTYWLKGVVRSNYNPRVIGRAITHSKMIVIDPFRDDCIVITGSHNFSKSASESNDENFIVVRGNKLLAEAYAVACLATYTHYHWRAYVHDSLEEGKRIWDHLSDKPEWQDPFLKPARIKEAMIWNKELKEEKVH